MRLSLQTDYALRALMYLAAKDGHHSIADIARGYRISKNHMMKVAQRLVAEGYVKSVRGRSGGLMLARPAKEINVGTLVRTVENIGGFVACFEPLGRGCVVTPVCGLRHALEGGIAAFMAHLDRFTIADLIADPEAFRAALDTAELATVIPALSRNDE